MEEQYIDHNVLNTLYLMSEDLGRAYEREGFNPFQEGYQMDTAQVDSILLNNEKADPIPSPDFLDGNTRSTLKHFALSEKNTDKLGSMVEAERQDQPSTRMNLEEVYLRCRKKMLQLAQNEIKNGGMSPLEAYEKMYRLNRSYAKVMEKTFLDSQLDFMKLREELAMSTSIQENIVRDPKAKVFSQSHKIPAKEPSNVRAAFSPEMAEASNVQKEASKKIPAIAPEINKAASESLREQIAKEELQKQKEEEIRKREEQLRQLNKAKKAKREQSFDMKAEGLSEDMLKNFYLQQMQTQEADIKQMQKLAEEERAKLKKTELKQKEDASHEEADKKDRDH